MAFELDTSGCVRVLNDAPDPYAPMYIVYGWSSHNPFVQGFLRAAFESASANSPWPDRGCLRDPTPHHPGSWVEVGYSDLDPASLAMVVRECESYERGARTRGLWLGTAWQGAALWTYRQAARSPQYPPLLITLSDTGKVVLTPKGEG